MNVQLGANVAFVLGQVMPVFELEWKSPRILPTYSKGEETALELRVCSCSFPEAMQLQVASYLVCTTICPSSPFLKVEQNIHEDIVYLHKASSAAKKLKLTVLLLVNTI